MISPAFEAMLETISTLKFANRAKVTILAHFRCLHFVNVVEVVVV